MLRFLKQNVSRFPVGDRSAPVGQYFSRLRGIRDGGSRGDPIQPCSQMRAMSNIDCHWLHAASFIAEQ